MLHLKHKIDRTNFYQAYCEVWDDGHIIAACEFYTHISVSVVSNKHIVSMSGNSALISNLFTGESIRIEFNGHSFSVVGLEDDGDVCMDHSAYIANFRGNMNANENVSKCT